MGATMLMVGLCFRLETVYCPLERAKLGMITLKFISCRFVYPSTPFLSKKNFFKRAKTEIEPGTTEAIKSMVFMTRSKVDVLR